MTDGGPEAFENAIIADMRAHGGAVTVGPMAGQPLLILTMTGARTGLSRRRILTFSRDGDDFILAGTNNGGPADPAWVANLVQHPDVSVEAQDRTFDAGATVYRDGTERRRLWDGHVAILPHFAAYPATSGRLIPMIRLTPTT